MGKNGKLGKIGTFGKSLERMKVRRICPKPESGPVLSIYDLPILLKYMYLLEDEDRDLMLLIFISGKRQEDIGRIFGITQEAVSYQVTKLKRRVRYIRAMQSVQNVLDRFFEYLMTEHGTELGSEVLETALLVFYTTSQTVSASMLGTSQAVVRHRFIRFVEYLNEIQDLPNAFENARKFFAGIQRRYNATRRIGRS